MSASMPLQALWTWRDAKIRQCVRGHSGEGGGVAVEYTGVYWGFEREAAVGGYREGYRGEERLRERGVLLEEGVGAAGERAKRVICAARSTKKHGGR